MMRGTIAGIGDELLKPVNKSLFLFAAFFILVCCAIQALTSLFYLAPLLIRKRPVQTAGGS